jgi:TonB family protein
MFWINLPRADFDRLAAQPDVAIKGRRLDLTLSSSGFAAVARALDTCNTNLRAHWNADEAGLARIGTMSAPIVAPARLVSSQDYPGQAIFEGRDGTTGVSLLIDEQGALKDCVVEQASGVATLDAQTCILFQTRGKFAAAKDRDGKPVKSRLTYRFRWKTG